MKHASLYQRPACAAAAVTSLERAMTKERPFGLSDDFDFDDIGTPAATRELLFSLPHCDLGRAARALYERRDRFGSALLYEALMLAWEHEERSKPIDAFATFDDFIAALREVAPPVMPKPPLRVWRGVAVRDLADSAIGLSWTCSRDVACWFATTYHEHARQPGIRCLVFTTVVEPSAIIAFNDARGEQEVLVDPAALDLSGVMVDGTSLCVKDLAADSMPPTEILADWLVAGQRFELFKRSPPVIAAAIATR